MFDPTNAIQAYSGVETMKIILAIIFTFSITALIFAWLRGRERLEHVRNEGKTETAVASTLGGLTEIARDSQRMVSNFLTALDEMNTRHTGESRDRDRVLSGMMEQLGGICSSFRQVVDSVQALNLWADQLEARVETNEKTLDGLGTRFGKAHEDTRAAVNAHTDAQTAVINGHTDDQIGRVLADLAELKTLVTASPRNEDIVRRLGSIEQQLNSISKAATHETPQIATPHIVPASDGAGTADNHRIKES